MIIKQCRTHSLELSNEVFIITAPKTQIDSTMYAARQIKDGFVDMAKNPILFLREVNRTYHSVRHGFDFYTEGLNVFEEDWDTLVILDGCRYDMFFEQSQLPGKLKKEQSRASHTLQFLNGNFDGNIFHDTVYTTATPQLERRRNHVDVEFHAVHNVWQGERWDNNEGTVLPDDMTEAAVEAHSQYPHKRHIIHYMQPHYPFIGSNIGNGTRNFADDPDTGYDIWNSLIRGKSEISAEEVWIAYRQNLNLVLGSISTLLDSINGKVVITSDHGNMVGERSSPIPIREWGHPSRLYTDQLVEIPWLICGDSNRRSIHSDSPKTREVKINDQVIDERLKDLGYL